MNKKNSVSKAAIAFYVVAVIFLFIFAFNIYYSYQYLGQYSLDFGTQWKEILGTYLGQSTPSFGFAIVTYGIGFLIEKLNTLQFTLSACLDDSVQQNEVKQEETDDLLAELQAEAMKKPKKAKPANKEEAVVATKEEVKTETKEVVEEETKVA